jgi:hypothetical protein
MKVSIRLSGFLLLAGLVAVPAVAQDRPFQFSVSTPRTQERHATMHYEAGFGERPFDLVEGERPEQRLGIQASLGRGLTLLARVGIAADGQDTRSSQQAELLYSVLHSPANAGSLAIGIGVRHESQGINVLLGRVATGRQFADWRLDGNALFEKPFSTGRDAVDLITTVGVARRLTSALYGGLEVIGEDLEGFWEEEEAEGGARLLVGPSIRVTPGSGHWQFGVAGGPIFHATRSARSSDATRALPANGGRDGFGVRASLSYSFDRR